MSNSPLVSYTKLSPNHSGQRTHAVDRITPHCVVGQCSVETLGNIFAPTSRQASCQYGIGVDGRVGMYVEEKNRSWCSSSNANDQRAITIECASDATHPYAFNDTVYAKLIELCVDICKRYGKTKLLWLGDKTKTLNYEPASNEMVLTVHRWFANKSCPGDWMYARMGDLASKVTAKLGGSAGGTETPADNQVLYRVQTGAFSNKANADAMLQKVKAAGFDTYMVKVDNLYKIQVGAFSKKANADAKHNNLETQMLIGLAHDRIIYLGMAYIERGYITQDEYENLYEYLYKPYEKLGGNGSAKRIMTEVDQLAIHKSTYNA